MINTEEGGSLMSLLSKGPVDSWLRYYYERYNGKSLIDKYDYQVVYGSLYSDKWSDDRKVLSICIEDNFDLLNLVDLYVNDTSENMSKLFDSVEVTVDGIPMDKMHCWEQMITTAALHGRTPTDQVIGKKNYCTVPLALAPFHCGNFVISEQGRIFINVQFKEPVPKHVCICFFGHKYYLKLFTNNIYLGALKQIKSSPYSFVSYQNKYCEYDVHKGFNSFRLNFHNPVSHIYFWGIDKTKIRNNVQLKVNGSNIYNGSIASLEHIKKNRGLGHIQENIIFFCEPSARLSKNDTKIKSSVNFSRIDYSCLIIDSMVEGKIKIAALNIVGVSYNNIEKKYGLIVDSEDNSSFFAKLL